MALQVLRASSLSTLRQTRLAFSTSTWRAEQALQPAISSTTPQSEASSSSQDGPPEAPPGLYSPFRPTSIAAKLSDPQFQLHVKCTHNNTIITLTSPENRPVQRGIWSGGLCGFKGVNRSGYEAAYQCAVRAFKRTEELMLENPVMKLELCMKGFGQGRDAVSKALMTSEGEKVRKVVNRITDKSPIKIGGTRAKKARRL
ncbi:hypothetical protein HETIRDRAFT_444154 [Heterobasidion irregulare TC 32-1]|uniref:Translational machinery component n=1 Tax=Heterobasidion irregulare (strain TC 32-1) TaxID=747525 RepID=W4KEZ1_HETIT|nr:uncharacterized protein HETIRDRAFT_444154 [Heterobasidion irregulare TC 32-1]ETW84279.1 hypothetical protein HETIRDRAFT_444154 [Heterobasidion irregulare TC 32-1]